MKITIFYFLLVLIFLNGCKQNDSIVQVNENWLKIPIENNINGKIIENMIGINIENQNNVKSRSISSGELEDQYLIDDFNNDGMADIAVRRGNLIIIDTNRDGISNLAFTFGYGNLERGYYTSNGGIAVVRNSSIFIDDNFDGLADRSFSFGNGNSESEYIFMKPSGIAVRRMDYNNLANHIYVDYNMDGYSDVDFFFGNGASENQYTHGFMGISGWALRRDYVWHSYTNSNTYSFGNGNSEKGYFLGEYVGGGNYFMGILRGNTIYYDSNMDGLSDGNYSFGTGLK